MNSESRSTESSLPDRPTGTVLPPGAQLGPYVIESLVGAGGMGQVYRARDTRLGRLVAVKVCQEKFSARFEREARAISALNHPHICTLHDIGPNYLVMEFVEGRTLRDSARPNGLPAETVIRYGGQIADALAHTHQQGILHRDLKSANVIVTPEGRTKVLDFGLAKRELGVDAEETRTQGLTESGVVLGTLPYMAPEVLRGEPAGARSDIWALGVVLYEMVTGRLPFSGQTGSTLSSAILKERPPALPERVPAALRAIIGRCLAKDPGQRYRQASELQAALETLQPAVGPAAAVAGRRSWLRASVGLAALAGVGGFFLWRSQPAPDGPPLTSTGEPASPNVEANYAFEAALSLLREQGDIPRTQALLERALGLDPHFGEARRWLGFNYLATFNVGFSNDIQLLHEGETELRQALIDEPRLTSVYSAMTGVYLFRGDEGLMLENLEKAVRAKPDDPEALNWQLVYRQFSGDDDGALDLAARMLDREPTFFPARMNKGEIYRTQGKVDDAIREQQYILDREPNNLFGIWYLSRAYRDSGMLENARAQLERGASVAPGNFLVRLGLALVLAQEGKGVEARAAMDGEVLAFARACFVYTLEVAEFYAVLAETGEALRWLDQAFRNGDQRAEWFRRDPLLENIRREPGFQRILDSIKSRREQRAKQASR